MTMPTLLDISPTGGVDLDEKCAMEHFLGKTQEQASALFFENSIYFIDDLRWMGGRAFVYYLPSVIPYLTSPESRGDSDAVDSLISILRSRLEDDAECMHDARALVLRVLTLIQDNFPKFEVDDE